MKHTEAKAFVRKYNSELAIRGYSKMKKADLAATIERKLDQSRAELKREWAALKAGPKPMAVKQGQKARQTGIKSRPPSADTAKSAAAAARARVGSGMKRPAAKRAAVKKPKTATEKRRAEDKTDDSWHARNKDSSGMAQANRLTSAISRIERRAAVQRDMALARRIRGSRY